MASQADVARHLDLSQPAVSQLIRDGILPEADRGMADLDACRTAYIRHLREIAAGRSEEDGEGERGLTAQRIRMTRERADALALKNAQARRELLPATEVTTAVHACFSRVRARLLGLPARAAPLLTGVTAMAEIQDKLTDAVHGVLRELALTGVEGIASPAPEPADNRRGPELVGGAGTTAEADGQRVGRRGAKAKPGGKRRAGRVEHREG